MILRGGVLDVVRIGVSAGGSPTERFPTQLQIDLLTLGTTCILAASQDARVCIEASGPPLVSGLLQHLAEVGTGVGEAPSSTAVLGLVSAILSQDTAETRECRGMMMESDVLWQHLEQVS
jgi:hypothetical protein